ncbi:MAG: hypothetical protein K2Q26_16220 [Bdellovibrionales bacterium]|nr:hypothetical protein [Bdellovibrionales bacterium]
MSVSNKSKRQLEVEKSRKYIQNEKFLSNFFETSKCWAQQDFESFLTPINQFLNADHQSASEVLRPNAASGGQETRHRGRVHDCARRIQITPFLTNTNRNVRAHEGRIPWNLMDWIRSNSHKALVGQMLEN